MSMGEQYLVAGMLLTYPLGALYRATVYHRSPLLKDVFFTITGITLYLFCFGWSAFHVFISSFGCYAFMCAVGISRVSCFLVFLATMSHLLYGYITVSGISYTVTWTLIHCQSTLKVIGYFLDLFDENETYPQNFLTFTGYLFFPFTSLVGPQFQYSRYTAFRANNKLPDSLMFSAKCLAQGVLYIALFYGLGLFLSTDFLISEPFLSYWLPFKLLYLTFWSKWLITKYCAIWLVSEGAAGLTGIGAEADGSWNGISNIDIKKFEFSLSIQDELSSFNIQTHQWVKRNVYKRCKIFRIPVLSRIISLIFLYLWHGIYFGFFNLFFVEGLSISCEQILSKHVSADTVERYVPRGLVIVGRYVIKNMCVGYGLCGFALRTFARCHVFYSSLYYCFHWGMLLWILVEEFCVRKKGREEEEEKKVE